MVVLVELSPSLWFLIEFSCLGKLDYRSMESKVYDNVFRVKVNGMIDCLVD